MDRQARRLLGRKERDDRCPPAPPPSCPQPPPTPPPPSYPFPPFHSNDELDEPRLANEGEAEAIDPKKETFHTKSGAGGGRKEVQYRHHPPRQRRRPPRGMHLSREDVEGVSANPELGAAALRQLDCQLVALKRQVGGVGGLIGGAKVGGGIAVLNGGAQIRGGGWKVGRVEGMRKGLWPKLGGSPEFEGGS